MLSVNYFSYKGLTLTEIEEELETKIVNYFSYKGLTLNNNP